MLKFICIIFLIVLLTQTSQAEIQAIDDTWLALGNTQIRIRLDDADNGDGVGDGAISIDGEDAVAPHGVSYEFQGSMLAGDVFNIETYVYNYRTSYVRYYVQLYNLTDNVLLTTSNLVTITGGTTSAVLTTLSYTAQASDTGDILQLKYIRGKLDQNGNYVGSDGNTARDFAIDNAKLNGQWIPSFKLLFQPRPVIDIEAEFPSLQEQMDMEQILSDMSDWMLGTTPPDSSQINTAIASYNDLNIFVSSDQKTITGTISDFPLLFTDWDNAEFLKIFARHLKFNPNDTTIYNNGLTLQQMVSRTIWLFTSKFYFKELPEDFLHYSFGRRFLTPAVFLLPYLNDKQKNLFYYTIYIHSKEFGFFWSLNYDIGLYGTAGSINIDHIGNSSHAQLVYGLLQDTWEEKLQWSKGFKRYYERFLTDTPGTSDGIKSDGSSFRHFSALNNYSYDYNTPMKVVSILDNTSFQVSQAAYKQLRKVIYTQLFLANDNVEALSMAGRHPDLRGISVNKTRVLALAEAGAGILGLNQADPVLTKAYARHWDLPSVNAELLYGFAQFNYHTAGVFWNNDWLAVSRGETNWGFGAEIFNRVRDNNLYGRYQSYGTLEIIYSGGQVSGNGFDWKGWDWNYNPGATTIVLPWELIRAEYIDGGQKELQKENFTGSLAFNIKNNPVLTKTLGETGIFAMNFVEDGVHWGHGNFVKTTHEESFKFKKSVFFFKDYILALGSNISNDDTQHPTVTTLFQRLSEIDPDHTKIIVDSTEYSNLEQNIFSENTDHWLVDNFNTGYYIINGSGDLHTVRSQQTTPKEDSFDLTLSSSFETSDYFIAYMNHGSDPTNSGYEYVVKPDTTTAEMVTFENTMSSSRPYTVYQKNENAHIVKDKAENLYALTLFSANSTLPNQTLIKANSKPCLIQYQETSVDTIKLALSNPDLNFPFVSFTPSAIQPIEVTLQGKWEFITPHPKAAIIAQNSSTTVFKFNTLDGLPIEIDLVKDIDSIFKSSFE